MTHKRVNHITENSRYPDSTRFAKLDAQARARVTVALTRMGARQSFEHQIRRRRRAGISIDVGPRYRVYFGRDGSKVVILLTGGTKRRQQRDIDAAKALWRTYKRET